MNKKKGNARGFVSEAVPQAGMMPDTTSGGASKAALTQGEENEMQARVIQHATA
jgi:hypothetical protein